MSAPTISNIGPDPTITCEARILIWDAIRETALKAKCTACDERRVGLITKRFTIKGSGEAIQKFIDIAWDHPDLSKSFRAELGRER